MTLWQLTNIHLSDLGIHKLIYFTQGTLLLCQKWCGTNSEMRLTVLNSRHVGV